MDVPIEILDQSMVGVAAGAYCEAACARIHSREPSTIHVPFWPPSPILLKIFVLRSHASVYINQWLCGLACEELLG